MTSENPLLDGALVSKARDGDGEARELLATRAGEAAYVFALQLSRSPDAARDIAQDSVLRFFRHLDRFDADRPVEPWIFSIVRNRVRDRARRDLIRSHGSLEAWLEGGGAEPASNEDPAATAERHELQQRVWRAISRLGDAHREIVVLRDYNGLSYREIAAVLAIPAGTVMSRLHAARQQLRRILVEDEDGRTSGDGTVRDDR